MLDFYNETIKSLEKILKEALEKFCKQEGKEEKKLEFLIEEPERAEFGDFATNIAMAGARVFKMAPLQLAEKISENLNLKESYFSKFEIKKPGFLNFFLNEGWFFKALKDVLKKGEDFGKTDFGQGKKVILEFVSANPTGPMHIGNARGGAIGDSLAECFKFCGFNVLKEFYVNDAGNQIEKFKKSLAVRYEQLFLKDENFEMPKDCYLGEDIILHAKNFAKIYKDKFMKLSEEERQNALLDYALPINIKNLELDLLKYNVKYDNWFFESSLYKEDKINYVINLLKEKGYVEEKNGALWFLFSKCGGQKDEVLVRENKIPTYFASDIAYHYNKFKVRGFDFAINVWGADHHGHIARLKAALKVLGVSEEKLEIVIMQMVRLVKKGETLKLSKRAGNTVTLNTLLELIPIEVSRFFFNMKDPNSHFDFDLDLAEQQSEKNPVYYVQYAYARACGILKNLKELGFVPNEDFSFSNFESEIELELIKQISKFPNEIIKAVETKNPSKIATFALELAALFHKFYVSCKIKGQERETIKARLLICKAFKISLKNALKILKIKAKEEI